MADMFHEQAARELLVGQLLDLNFGQIDEVLKNMALDPEDPNYELDPATDRVIAQFYANHPGQNLENETGPDPQLFVQAIAMMASETITFLLRKADV